MDEGAQLWGTVHFQQFGCLLQISPGKTVAVLFIDMIH